MQYYMDQNLHKFFSIATSPKNQLIEYLFIYINLILSSFVSVFKNRKEKSVRTILCLKHMIVLWDEFIKGMLVVGIYKIMTEFT